MCAPCPDIPVVVLPENNVVRGRTRLSEPVETALGAAITALMGLHAALLNPDGAGDGASEAMDCAVDRVRRLAAQATVAPMDTTSLTPIVPNHEYFGVRTANIDDAYLVSEVTKIIVRALTDLRAARLDLNDRAAEVRSMAQILIRLAPGSNHGSAPQPTGYSSGHPALRDPGCDELTRWIITHHLYFVLNLAAADTVSRAITALTDGERDVALGALHEAVLYVRGFTAAMVHSGDMSAACYDEKVRPTMQPPAVPVALTGRTQPEHRAFRKAMRALATVSPESFDMLAATDLELAVARDALLEADLQDIERHIIVAAALVGNDSSIVRTGESAESAIAVLRTMRHTRAESYCDLMRFGDRITLAAL
jgi:hypothetical protein